MAINNGGLARRHAVALKIEKPGVKGCLGGIASAGWLEDHQIQSFSRETLFELCKKKNAPVFEVLAMETLRNWPSTHRRAKGGELGKERVSASECDGAVILLP